MTRNAPHLVRAMPQLVPLLPSMGRMERALVRAGFLAGDVLRKTAGTPAAILPGSCRIPAQRVSDMAPAVRRNGLDGGLLAYDGQLIDDARLVAAVARTAAQQGARILTYAAASEVTGMSLRLTDQRTGESFDMSARAVINATGVWAGEIDPSLKLRPSRGTHLVFDAAALGNPTAALTIPIPGELNRFVFAMPEQLGRVYLGLTDEEAPGPIPDVPQPTPGEMSFLLDVVNTALGITLESTDVIGAYAGLRPLIDTGAGRTADVSRNHAVVESPSGVISVVGGKLTEYRHMAEDVLDRAIEMRGLTAGECRTRNLPLVGAPANPGSTVAPMAGLPESLVLRYGAEAAHVIAVATCERPVDPVADGIDVIRAEFEYAITHEGALTVDDIVDRRTRIGLVAADRQRVVGVAHEMLEMLGQK
jgi:glycerol-3-phosphate dehydrogenase